jgi:hypothetical protein
MTPLKFAVDIKDRILKDQPFKKFMSKDGKTIYLEFYECDLPSITYEFNKTGFKEIIKILTLDGSGQ